MSVKFLHRIPPIELERVDVPETSTYWPGVSAEFHTGTETVAKVVDEFTSIPPQRVAMDIETHGVADGRWSITCVTAAFYLSDGLHSVLLNPLRVDEDRGLLRRIFEHATSVVFHNSPFDIPVLFVHGLMTYQEVRKVEDTILLSYMMETIRQGGRTLETLAQRFGVADDSSVKITDAFVAAGYRNKDEGYTRCDIDRPFYRMGAMSDTAATLQLWNRLYPIIVNIHTRGGVGAPSIAQLSPSEAEELVMKIQRVNQITLQMSCRGLAWDPDTYDQWHADQEESVEGAKSAIRAVGLEPGQGAHLIQYLSSRGELPGDWPTTEKGALKSDKAAMERLSSLGHPLTQAHTIVAEYEKNSNYLKKIKELSGPTGRVHYTTKILGAHASGRMSITDPALQQFSEDARPVIRSDGEDWWSVDWSSIEPVVLANCAGDRDFIEPFNAGGDLYIPLARNAGLIPNSVSDEAAANHQGRKQAKVMLLAAMYGQGLPSLAASMGITMDEAKKIQGGIRRAMSATFAFMRNVESACESSGASWTILGRMLNEAFPDGDIKSRVAVNHFCQGSAADVLMDTVLRLDQMGVSDELRLLIHDEIVTTEYGLEAVKEAMSTPPEALVHWSEQKGMVPILRIDAQNMGKHWQKV